MKTEIKISELVSQRAEPEQLLADISVAQKINTPSSSIFFFFFFSLEVQNEAAFQGSSELVRAAMGFVTVSRFACLTPYV